MRKVFALLLFFCIGINISLFAQSNSGGNSDDEEEITLSIIIGNPADGRSLITSFHAYLSNNIIVIKTAETSISIDISITQQTTGDIVYQVLNSPINYYIIPLINEEKGEYLLEISINGKLYVGEFTLQ